MPRLKFLIAICFCAAWVNVASASSILFGWGGFAMFQASQTPDTIEMTLYGGIVNSPSTDPIVNNTRIETVPLLLNATPNNGRFSFQTTYYTGGFRLIDIVSGNTLGSADIGLNQLTLDVNANNTSATLNSQIQTNLFNVMLEPAGTTLLQNTNSPALLQFQNNSQLAFNLTLPLATNNLTEMIGSGQFGTSFAASLSATPPGVVPPITMPVPSALTAGLALFCSIALRRRRRL